MDINAVLEEKDIVFAEKEANRVVFDNVPVITYFPSSEELSGLKYRAKLDLTENVRLVKIGEHDLCACCAPHVKRSGEVGSIRLLDFAKHRGGTRITITAGARAVYDSRFRYETVREISGLLSVPKNDVADGVRKLISDYEELKLEIKKAKEDYYLLLAKSIAPREGNLVLYYPEADAEDVKIVANELA
jgi:alanyl-tRNA synthetase